jgi:SAM-dependent methyltransferase
MPDGLTYADPLLRGSEAQLGVTDSDWSADGQGALMLSPSCDQLPIWERLHQQYDPPTRRPSPATPLARSLARYLAPSQNVLELGCGNGADAAFLSRRGHTVIATDFSEYAIETARKIYQNSNLVFQAKDLRHPLDFDSSTFNVVYARLSLHYFSDALTRAIVCEVGRVLVPGGQFLFMCKSTRDPLCGKGDVIAPQIYCYEGHIRHFFDRSYTADLLSLDGFFKIRRLRLVEQSVYGFRSSVIVCLARRVGNYRQPRLI